MKDVKPTGLRAARVRENEERIVRAAHELFARDGYQATTLTAVADAAGVGHRTVYVRFGTKGALLKRVIDVALVGDLAPVDVVSREWFRTATTAATLGERVAALAKGSARLMASAADVIAVAREAEAAEPLLAAAAHAGRVATRDTIRAFWTRARDDGLLPPGCDLAWLADTTGVLAHAETYLLMRETLGITPEGYEEWLAVTWHRMAAAATAKLTRRILRRIRLRAEKTKARRVYLPPLLSYSTPGGLPQGPGHGA